jgi:hypothetical protein
MNEKIKNITLNNLKIATYRFQLWPGPELIKLVQEAVRVSHDPLIGEMRRGWFARLIRAALTCYIAYCKTMAQEIEKEKTHANT